MGIRSTLSLYLSLSRQAAEIERTMDLHGVPTAQQIDQIKALMRLQVPAESAVETSAVPAAA